jgi:SPP1 family predicted phage head-tail adaptor
MKKFAKKGNATKRCHRIQIQQVSSEPNGRGGRIETWQTINTVWAQILPKSAIQTFKYQTISAEMTHLVNISALIPVVETNRILFDSRIFEILTISNDEERNYDLNIECKEVR